MLGEDRVDLVVLGRCMPTVTDRLIEPHRYRLINTYRSMLRALLGVRPYQQARPRLSGAEADASAPEPAPAQTDVAKQTKDAVQKLRGLLGQ